MTCLICDTCQQPLPEHEDGHRFKSGITYTEENNIGVTSQKYTIINLLIGSGSGEPLANFHICKSCFKKAVEAL